MDYQVTLSAVGHVADVMEGHLAEHFPAFAKIFEKDGDLPEETAFGLFLELHYVSLTLLDRLAGYKLGHHEAEVVMSWLAAGVQLHLKERFPMYAGQIDADLVSTLNARIEAYGTYPIVHYPGDEHGWVRGITWNWGKAIAHRFRDGNPAVAALASEQFEHIWEVCLKLFKLYEQLRG